MNINPKALKLIFMGSPEYTLPILKELLTSNHLVKAAFTEPDKLIQRNKIVLENPIKQYCKKLNIPIFQFAKNNNEKIFEEVLKMKPDAIIIASYGVILPKKVLEIPPLGCINIHPSMLPKYRGPSPIPSTILNGDYNSGVTLMKLDTGMDTGPIIAQEEFLINSRHNTSDLTKILFSLGGKLLTKILPDYASGNIQVTPQNDKEATITLKIKKTDGLIKWTSTSEYIKNQIKAFTPWPGTYTYWQGKRMSIHDGNEYQKNVNLKSTPGAILQLPNQSIGVATATNFIELKKIQLEGKKVLSVKEFLMGYPDLINSYFGSKT